MEWYEILCLQILYPSTYHFFHSITKRKLIKLQLQFPIQYPVWTKMFYSTQNCKAFSVSVWWNKTKVIKRHTISRGTLFQHRYNNIYTYNKNLNIRIIFVLFDNRRTNMRVWYRELSTKQHLLHVNTPTNTPLHTQTFVSYSNTHASFCPSFLPSLRLIPTKSI